MGILSRRSFQGTVSVSAVGMQYGLKGASEYIDVHPDRPVSDVILVEGHTFPVSGIIPSGNLP